MGRNGGSKIMTGEQLEKLLGGIAAKVLSTVAEKFAEAVIEGTPVDTGRLSGQWNLTFNGESDAPPGRVGRDAALAAARAEAARCVMINGPAHFTLSNNTFYAHFVEFGTSRMAPRLMVHRAIQQLDQIMAAAAVEVQFVATPPTKVG